MTFYYALKPSNWHFVLIVFYDFESFRLMILCFDNGLITNTNKKQATPLATASQTLSRLQSTIFHSYYLILILCIFVISLCLSLSLSLCLSLFIVMFRACFWPMSLKRAELIGQCHLLAVILTQPQCKIHHHSETVFYVFQFKVVVWW